MKIQNVKREWKKCEPEYAVLTVILLLFLVVGAVWIVFAPKEDFSEDENRALEPTPKLSAESLLDSSFMDSVESYIGDHFPLRKQFISLYNATQYGMGKRDVGGNYSSTPAEGGVYFGRDGHLYEVLLPDRTGIFEENAQALVNFAKAVDVPVYILPAPSGSQEQSEKLPLFAPNHSQREELQRLRELAGDEAVVVDTFDALSSINGDYYYKTDHHWNTFGAYAAYQVLCSEMGLTATPMDSYDFRTVTQPFYGTLYSKAVSWFQQPDRMYLPELKQPQQITQYVNGTEPREGIYWEEYLDQKDKYSVYLGGNRGVDVVKNADVTNGRKLLILKDSYANSMIPYLSTNFSEIHLIDLRYYNFNVYDYMEEQGITDAAAIYSVKQLCDVSIANKLIVR